MSRHSIGDCTCNVAVCTKDRSFNLERVVCMINRCIPHSDIKIFEGSLKPKWNVLNSLKERFNVEVVLVPYLKFGHVRNIIMTTCTSDFVAMIDDDISIGPEWFGSLMQIFENAPDVVAVSSKLIFGEGIVKKLTKANKRISGGAGGAAIYRRKAVLDVGNFNPYINRGEDMELELRIHCAGQKWVKCQNVVAYHPGTLHDFLDRPKANVTGWTFIMQYSNHKWRFLVERVGSCFVMPIYYFLQTLDLRILGVYSIYKWKALLYYLSGKYVK